jgi:hypothetical protein
MNDSKVITTRKLNKISRKCSKKIQLVEKLKNTKVDLFKVITKEEGKIEII